MLLTCNICGKGYSLSYRRGWKFLPPVCSKECLVEYIKKFNLVRFSNGTPYVHKRQFQSKLEQEIYEFLVENDIPTLYEPYVLRKKGRTYIPDFYLPKQGIFIEAKGRWNSYEKFRIFAEDNPILLIDYPFWRSL